MSKTLKEVYRLPAVILLTMILFCGNTAYSFASDSKVSVTQEQIKAFNVPDKAELITAVYSDEMLVDSRRYQGSETIIVDFQQDMAGNLNRADTLRVFLWDVETLLPICRRFSSLITDLPREDKNQIQIHAGGRTFIAAIEENKTARAFREMLPVTFDMHELNGNEKYCYLPQTLPQAPEQVTTIHAGDIMLYGSNCIVLFYETFQTSYSYTKIGHIADISGLKSALGAGDITLLIE